MRARLNAALRHELHALTAAITAATIEMRVDLFMNVSPSFAARPVAAPPLCRILDKLPIFPAGVERDAVGDQNLSHRGAYFEG